MALPRGYISHSQIRSYNECPQKYRFAYVENIQPVINEKVFLGEVFHSALEHCFQQRISGSPPADDAVEIFFRAAFEEGAAEREIAWQSPRGETRERGLAFLRYFLKNVAPAMRPLMVEKELCAELPASGVLLKGVIDLVEEDFGITDFKTTTSRWSESRVRNSPQMIIYKYLFDRCFGPVPASLKYEIFYGKKAGNVRHQTLLVVPAADAVDSLLAMIEHVVERIDSGAFQPNVTPFCRYCEFRSLCRETGPD
jgi:putative RecB family exonuclease